MKNVLFFIIILSICIGQGCKQKNLLKTDEQALAEIIKHEDAQKKKDYSAPGIEHPDSLVRLPSGLRLKEIRSVDSDHPPVILDVIASRDNIKEFKLSDVASSVRYIKLEIPRDTNLFLIKLSLHFTEKGIITKSLAGITHFSQNGKFIETVCLNKMNLSGFGTIGASPGRIMFSINTFEGNFPQSEISVFNNRIFYKYDSGPEETSRVISYQLAEDQDIQLNLLENPEQILVKGNKIAELEYSAFFGFGSNRILAINDDQWINFHSKWDGGTTGTMMVSYSQRGDTLCTFADHDRIANFNSSVIRQAEDEFSYYYNGILTIKPAYNDTIFRVISLNRLLPVYIINFGPYKPTHLEGLHPSFDLSNKFILCSLTEIPDWVFFIYSQNYTSPANLRNKTVKFYYTLFNKKEEKLYHYPEVRSEKIGIENDLDGGYPFWPEYVTLDNELVMAITGKQFRDYIFSDEFENMDISKDLRDNQVRMVNSLEDYDCVLMFAK